MKYCKIILDDYDFKYKSKKRSPPIQQRKLIQSWHKNAATPKSRLPKLLIEEKHHSERDSTAYRDFQLATTYHHKLCFNILDMDLIHLNRNILQGYCDRFTYRIHQTNYRVVEYEYIPHLQNNNSTTHIYELLYYTPSTKVEDITQYQQSLNNLTNGLNRTGNQVYLDLPNRLKEFIQSCLSRQIMKVLHYFGDSEHKSLTFSAIKCNRISYLGTPRKGDAYPCFNLQFSSSKLLPTSINIGNRVHYGFGNLIHLSTTTHHHYE